MILQSYARSQACVSCGQGHGASDAPRTPRYQPEMTGGTCLHTTTMSSPIAMSSDVKSEKAERRSPTQRRSEPTSDIAELHRRLDEDPRFNPPTPSPWKRAALILLVVFLFWLGVTMRKQMAKQPEIIHASRSVFSYSAVRPPSGLKV